MNNPQNSPVQPLTQQACVAVAKEIVKKVVLTESQDAFWVGENFPYGDAKAWAYATLSSFLHAHLKTCTPKTPAYDDAEFLVHLTDTIFLKTKQVASAWENADQKEQYLCLLDEHICHFCEEKGVNTKNIQSQTKEKTKQALQE